jgi:hypothetical protein
LPTMSEKVEEKYGDKYDVLEKIGKYGAWYGCIKLTNLQDMGHLESFERYAGNKMDKSFAARKSTIPRCRKKKRSSYTPNSQSLLHFGTQISLATTTGNT